MNPRQRCHATAEIDAPIAVAWQAMTDFAAYGDWNPFVIGVDVLDPEPERDFGVGSRLRLHVDMQGSRTTALERVAVWEPPVGDGERAELTYDFDGPLTRFKLLYSRRSQVLEALGPARCRYVTEEVFTGVLWRALPFAKLDPGFAAHAAALKARGIGGTNAIKPSAIPSGSSPLTRARGR